MHVHMHFHGDSTQHNMALIEQLHFDPVHTNQSFLHSNTRKQLATICYYKTNKGENCNISHSPSAIIPRGTVSKLFQLYSTSPSLYSVRNLGLSKRVKSFFLVFSKGMSETICRKTSQAKKKKKSHLRGTKRKAAPLAALSTSCTTVSPPLISNKHGETRRKS